MSINRHVNRSTRLLDSLPAPERTHAVSSYCLYCGHFHYGEALVHCSRCHGKIFQWVPDAELRLFRSRSSLQGF